MQLKEQLFQTTQARFGCAPDQCDDHQLYEALLILTRSMAQDRPAPGGARKLYYFSAEFLMGKLLSNNLLALGIHGEVKELLADLGRDLGVIESMEPEPSLGNGGLGRLAACFLDSIAALGLPGDGVGLNYHYGLFRQKFDKNRQTEVPDPWMEADSWLIPTGVAFNVPFGGFDLKAVLYDIAIPGAGNQYANRLHLFDVAEPADKPWVGIDFDKEDIALGATNGYAQPTDVGITPICPQVPTDFTGLERDVERAKQLVAEAGYPDGVDVTMRVISASNYTKPAEVVQDQLKEIGINITIEPMERAAWWDACYLGGDYTITIYANPVQVIDADFGAYPFLHSSEANGGNNFYNYKSAEMDKLLEDARISQNEAERKELYTKVCEIIRDESIFVPMYTGERTYAGVKGLQGVKADPMVRYYTYRYSWS